jgi:WD40 repeat protein
MSRCYDCTVITSSRSAFEPVCCDEFLTKKLRVCKFTVEQQFESHCDELVSKMRKSTVCNNPLPKTCNVRINCGATVNSVVHLHTSVVATCHYDSSFVHICDIRKGSKLYSIHVVEHIHEIVRVGEDHLLCAAYQNGLWLLNWKKKKVVSMMVPARNLSGCVTHSKMKCFGKDDRYVLACLGDQSVAVFDVYSKGMESVKTFKGEHENSLTCLEIISKGRFCSASRDSFICVWSMEQDKCINKLSGFTGGITSLCVIDEFKLASGSNNGEIRIWDINSATCHKVFGVFNGVICEMARLSSCLFLAGDAEGMIRVWDIHKEANEHVQEIKGHECWTYCNISLKHNGHTYIISGGQDKLLKVWGDGKETSSCVMS